MRKSFIVENVEANFNKITCLSDEIKEGIEFRCLNALAYGILKAEAMMP